jgi:hypothetical protein
MAGGFTVAGRSKIMALGSARSDAVPVPAE